MQKLLQKAEVWHRGELVSGLRLGTETEQVFYLSQPGTKELLEKKKKKEDPKFLNMVLVLWHSELSSYLLHWHPMLEPLQTPATPLLI